ncbi:MAG: tetratricopeptide repeat protein [Pyrinomonadaceae bacterium]|nr:tetratricopeptide repeat protein [Pyrinomonadaceae bacterium]
MKYPYKKAHLVFSVLFAMICTFSGIAGETGSLGTSNVTQAQDLIYRAYKYRLKGRFRDAEAVLRNGMQELSLEKGRDVQVAGLKVELARVIIRKNFHNNTSDEEALRLYRDAEEIAKKAENKGLLGKALYGIGFYKFKLGSKSWDNALASLYKSLKIRREIGDTFGISQSLFTIGTIYQRRGKAEAAEKIYEESLQLAKDAKSIYMEGENERHIGYLFYLRGEFDSALPHFFRSLEKRRTIGYDDGEIFALITIGQTYEKLGDLEKAKRYLKKALPIARSINSRVAQTRIYASLGSVFYDQKKTEKARISLNKAKQYATLIGYTSTVKGVQELLEKLEEN